MTPTNDSPIKIAHAAGKPVFLHANGNVECGRVIYGGKYTREFKDIHHLIDDHLRRYRVRNRDVSGPRILSIEDLADRMVERWQRTISVSRIQRLAEEARIRRLVTQAIFPVFTDYVNRRWRSAFAKMSEEERALRSTADKLF